MDEKGTGCVLRQWGAQIGDFPTAKKNSETWILSNKHKKAKQELLAHQTKLQEIYTTLFKGKCFVSVGVIHSPRRSMATLRKNSKKKITFPQTAMDLSKLPRETLEEILDKGVWNEPARLLQSILLAFPDDDLAEFLFNSSVTDRNLISLLILSTLPEHRIKTLIDKLHRIEILMTTKENPVDRRNTMRIALVRMMRVLPKNHFVKLAEQKSIAVGHGEELSIKLYAKAMTKLINQAYDQCQSERKEVEACVKKISDEIKSLTSDEKKQVLKLRKRELNTKEQALQNSITNKLLAPENHLVQKLMKEFILTVFNPKNINYWPLDIKRYAIQTYEMWKGFSLAEMSSLQKLAQLMTFRYLSDVWGAVFSDNELVQAMNKCLWLVKDNKLVSEKDVKFYSSSGARTVGEANRLVTSYISQGGIQEALKELEKAIKESQRILRKEKLTEDQISKEVKKLNQNGAKHGGMQNFACLEVLMDAQNAVIEFFKAFLDAGLPDIPVKTTPMVGHTKMLSYYYDPSNYNPDIKWTNKSGQVFSYKEQDLFALTHDAVRKIISNDVSYTNFDVHLTSKQTHHLNGMNGLVKINGHTSEKNNPSTLPDLPLPALPLPPVPGHANILKNDKLIARRKEALERHKKTKTPVQQNVSPFFNRLPSPPPRLPADDDSPTTKARRAHTLAGGETPPIFLTDQTTEKPLEQSPFFATLSPRQGAQENSLPNGGDAKKKTRSSKKKKSRRGRGTLKKLKKNRFSVSLKNLNFRDNQPSGSGKEQNSAGANSNGMGNGQ